MSATATEGLTTTMADWTRDTIVAAALDFHEREGRAPTRWDWSHASADNPSYKTVARLFGPVEPWQTLRVAAGLELATESRWTAMGEVIERRPNPGAAALEQLQRHCGYVSSGSEPDRARLIALVSSAMDVLSTTPRTS